MLLEENSVITAPKRPFFKKLGRIFLWIIGLLLVFVLGLLGLLLIYEDEVKAALVTELNKHLRAEIRIAPKNIELTILKTFPDCSIEFKDLLMLEALPIKQRDTLLFAQKLNLHFNIEDLWNKHYEIEKIKLKGAIVKLRVLKDGSENYIFWKKDKQNNAPQKDSLKFNLKWFSIEDSRLSYKNKKTLFKTAVHIKRLSFKGQFSAEKYDMEADAKLLIEELVQGKTTYLRNKTVDLSLGLLVEDDTYTIRSSRLNLNKLALELKGTCVYNDSLERLELKYNAPQLDISSAMSLLPQNFKTKVSDYESDGNFYASGTFRYLNKHSYSLVSNFGVRRGSITYKPHAAKAEDVNLEGYLNYSNAASVLDLKNIHLSLNNDRIEGNCLINNLNDPYLKLSASASVKLENLLNFWPVDTLSELKGNLKVKTEIAGSLRALKNQTFSDKVKLDLEAKVSALEAHFKGDEKTFRVENCELFAKEREIEVRELKLKRGSSDITVNGKIPGVFNYLMDHHAPLTIKGSLYSDYIKMEDFTSSSTGASSGNDHPLIPANVNFNLRAAILKFSFGKFEARSITGEIDIKDQKAIVTEMKLQTMQGEASIDAFADNSKKKLDITLQAKLKDLSITELFRQLNSFGQSTLTDKNIKGLATSTIAFSGSWNNRLVADPASIRASCNLQIEQGELNDFKPLLSLSRFVDVEELRRVKFSSLQSAIEIRNSSIILPRTSIKNSALDIEVWGTHTFDNHIDYHIQLLISHYLSKKRKNQDSEFGPVENDPDNRRSAFILMTGMLDDPKIKYDTKGLKEKIRNDLKAERNSMKQLLKEELNLFKKDTSLKKTKKEVPAFELEKPSAPTKKTLEPKKKPEEEDDF